MKFIKELYNNISYINKYNQTFERIRYIKFSKEICLILEVHIFNVKYLSL